MTQALYTTAIHEAAHAVVAVRTARGRKHGLAKNGVVTIERDAGTNLLGFVNTKNSGHQKHKWQREIMVSIAGGMAEHRINPLGDVGDGLSGDIRNIISDLGNFYPSAQFKNARHLLFYEETTKKQDRSRLYDLVHEHFLQRTNAYQIAEAKLLIDKISVAASLLCAAGNSAEGVRRILKTVPVPALAIIQEPWFKTLGELTDKTSKLLDLYWREVHTLANLLLERHTIPGPEAEAFIRGEEQATLILTEEQKQILKQVSSARRRVSQVSWGAELAESRKERKEWRRKYVEAKAVLKAIVAKAKQLGVQLPKWRGIDL